jgi:hypothetical protein
MTENTAYLGIDPLGQTPLSTGIGDLLDRNLGWGRSSTGAIANLFTREDLSLIGTAKISTNAAEVNQAVAISTENFVFKNFNQPLITSRSATDTDSVVANDLVLGVATAETFFRLDDTTNQDLGQGSVINRVIGQGQNFDGLAEGFGTVGGTFFVEAGESFSFEFLGYLNLETAVQNAETQKAIASGQIAFGVYDVTDAEATEQSVRLDLLNVSGGLDTPGNLDFLNLQTFGSNINLNPQETRISRHTGGLEESTFVAVSGIYQTQPFARDTLLVLGDLDVGV